jgi:hypothetical protein
MAAFWQDGNMLKVQAILQDGSVGLEFMTDDASEAAEMRELWLAFDCVAEVLVLDEPTWLRLE